MTRILILAGAALTLSAGAALSADMVQVKTEAEFRKLIVGKKLDWGTGHQMFHADGKVTALWKGHDLIGTWNWTGDTYCRTLGIKGRTPQYDCRTVAVKENTATITRKGGKGESYNVTIKDK